MNRAFTIIRRNLASPADAAAFLRQKRAGEKLATTTSVAQHLRHFTAGDFKPSKAKLDAHDDMSHGSGRTDVDNTSGKGPKLSNAYAADSHDAHHE